MKFKPRRFRKKPGASPGQAVFVGEDSELPFSIELTTYEESFCRRKTLDRPDDIEKYLDHESKAWIHVSGIHQVEEVEMLAKRLNLDRLSLEDILNTDHRPKIAFVDPNIVVILKVIEPKNTGSPHQLALVYTKDMVVTFSNCPINFFQPIFQRIERDSSRLRRYGSDYLTWAILDLVIDHYLIVSEDYESLLDEFDDRLLDNSVEIDSARLFSFKSQVNKLHRLIRPVREIIHHLRRTNHKLLSDQTKPFFEDLYDHIIHVIEDAEQLREQATEIRDFYLATVNNRMNEVMKLLTCFSAIFLPLTFLVGVYGMNFEFMPELTWRWSYPAIWLLFGVSTFGFLVYFKKKKWL